MAGRSNYDIKGRLLSTLTWQHKFFGDYVSSVSGVYNGYTGQPYSWTFGNDANGDGIRGNDLFYVPRVGEAQFTPGTSQAAIDQFYALIQSNDYLQNHQGGTVGQNGATSPWINQINLSLRQEIPGLFKGNKGEIRFDIFNIGNLINKDWGQIYNPNFPYNRSPANFAGVDPATGKYIYNLTSPGSYAYSRQDDQAQSRWSVLVTLRYTFTARRETTAFDRRLLMAMDGQFAQSRWSVLVTLRKRRSVLRPILRRPQVPTPALPALWVGPSRSDASGTSHSPWMAGRKRRSDFSAGDWRLALDLRAQVWHC